MTKRSQIQHYITTLREIKAIMKAMKNLSLIEVNKTEQLVSNAQTNSQILEQALADITQFFSDEVNLTMLANMKPSTYIVIGSERGFCANFNHLLINKLTDIAHKDVILIPIGTKLINNLVKSDWQFTDELPGASVTEEINGIILQLIELLQNINFGDWAIVCIAEQQGKLIAEVVYPFSALENLSPKTYANSPFLQLPPRQILGDLLQHYMLVIFYQLFYRSFYLENKYRVQHMEGALEWLKKRINIEKLEANILRQEEITEELELLLLKPK